MNKVKIDLNGKSILVTGSPGFIGANLVLRLLKEMTSGTIVSLDNMNDYYDPALKEYRLSLIEKAAETSPVKHFFVKGTLADKALIDKLFAEYKFDIVVNLAAQAGEYLPPDGNGYQDQFRRPQDSDRDIEGRCGLDG